MKRTSLWHIPDRVSNRAQLDILHGVRTCDDSQMPLSSAIFHEDQADRARRQRPILSERAKRTMQRIANAKADGLDGELRRIVERAKETIARTGSSEAVAILDTARAAIFNGWQDFAA